jgi:S-adenosylmethionine hydrolase
VGSVIHIDNFGNLITNIQSDDLPQGAGEITVEVGNQSIPGISRNYAGGGGLLALFGSSGYLEVALKEDSASSFLSAEVGYEVRIRRAQK